MDETRSDNPGSRRTGSGHLRLADINHEEYDALADLFLGAGGYAPARAPAVGGTDQEADSTSEITDSEPIVDQARPPSHETHTPVLHLTRGEEDAQIGAGPKPARPAPQDADATEATRQRARGVLEFLDATDASASALLAELLGEQHIQSVRYDDDREARGTPDPVAERLVEMPRPTLEVVVLGHLPVRATLWARQYACSLARERGETVALIRAASGSTSIDLIQGDDPIDNTRSFGQLSSALDFVSARADRVILRVDESSEPELLERAEVEEITILTGADEAAIVASYRLIKTLDATLTRRVGDDEGPVFRLAVMGATRELALDACNKLENAVKTFIARPIEIAVGSGRIDATGTLSLYRDSVVHRPATIIDGLVEAARKEDETARHHRRAEAEAEPEAGPAVEPAIEKDLKRETDPERPRVEFPRSGVSITPPPARASSSARPENDPPRPDAPTKAQGLCALIPGLTPIESRCPAAQGVELATDERGLLHLLVCDGDTRGAVQRLLAARSWARANLSLLIRAEPGLAIPRDDRDEEPGATMHLITRTPSAVSELYGTSVRVYALARVALAGQIAQVATPVN